MIFTANLILADAQEFYGDVTARLARYGWPMEDLLVMPGIFPVLGGTEAAAKSLVHPAIAWGILRQHYRCVDLSGSALDDIAPPLPGGSKSRLKLVSDLVECERPTPRQLSARYRPRGPSHQRRHARTDRRCHLGNVIHWLMALSSTG